MTFVEISLLAIIQGLTEFLPVSSSGHLLAARYLLGISDIDGTAFDTFLHFGTLLAVLVYYRETWWRLLMGIIKRGPDSSEQRQLFASLCIATVPAAVIGYLFQDQIVQFFRSPKLLVLFFLFTAFVLFWFDRRPETKKVLNQIKFRDAFRIGLWQLLALFPGVSRSGMTIAGGRFQGLSRQQAATFSFLLSAPIIAGASLSSIPTLFNGHNFAIWQLLMGGAISFAVGLIAIYLLLKYVERISFRPFAIYLLFLAVALFMWL